MHSHTINVDIYVIPVLLILILWFFSRLPCKNWTFEFGLLWCITNVIVMQSKLIIKLELSKSLCTYVTMKVFLCTRFPSTYVVHNNQRFNLQREYRMMQHNSMQLIQ